MNPMVQKVLERLAYERLLLTSGLVPRRRTINLSQVLRAGISEPRILQVLPAILLYKPKVIRGVAKDLKEHPGIRDQVERLFEPSSGLADFCGTDINDCRKAAMTYRNYLETLRLKNRHRLFNLRLNDEDWKRLEILSKQLGLTNYSEILRRLIHKAV